MKEQEQEQEQDELTQEIKCLFTVLLFLHSVMYVSSCL